MKSFYLVTALLCTTAFPATSQSFRGLDKSPLDIAYFPDHFAHDRKEGDKALVKVIYSRPHKNGREIFGNLVPYGKVWRTGANENTQITFYEDAMVAGEKIRKGTYSLFTIPEKNSWTIIINSDLDYWGAYSYNEKNDLLRVTVKSETLENDVENFSIQFEGQDNKTGTMLMAWGKVLVRIPLHF